jgi:Transcription factor WhiB
MAGKRDTWTRRVDGSPAPGGLPTSLRGLRDAVLEGEPGCVCDPELFTGPAGIEPEAEAPGDRAARVEVARQVCAVCPVQRLCLAYALRTRPAAGVWAGFTPEEITGLIAAAARPARVRRSTALRPAVIAGPQDARVAS